MSPQTCSNDRREEDERRETSCNVEHHVQLNLNLKQPEDWELGEASYRCRFRIKGSRVLVPGGRSVLLPHYVKDEHRAFG